MSEECVHNWYSRFVGLASSEFFCMTCGKKLTITRMEDHATELEARIAELKAVVERLIELGDVINGDKDSVWTLQTIKECWTEDVTKWKEREDSE